ncbi:MAG: hypothetical protein NT069_32225 [Planctomycetota bacterium]|nr:hypothetical protein [Planctomycetota bacterium]
MVMAAQPVESSDNLTLCPNCRSPFFTPHFFQDTGTVDFFQCSGCSKCYPLAEMDAMHDQQRQEREKSPDAAAGRG